MWLDLTLNPSFKVKQCETNLQEIMGWESFDVVRFDLWHLLQDQAWIAKIKSTYNSRILVPGGLQCDTNL